MVNRALRVRRDSVRCQPLCEALESRLLLSSAPSGPINILPSNISGLKLAPGIVTGTEVKGSFKVIVAEDNGNSTGSAPISVVAFLRPDGGGSDISITPKAATVNNIKADKSKTATLKYDIPSSLPAGDYSLVITVDPDNTVTETAEGDNTLVVADVLSSQAPFVSISASLDTSKIPPFFSAGSKKNIPLQLLLANSGNIKSPSGSVTVSIVVHEATNGDLTTISKVLKLPAIKAGKTGKLASIPISVPNTIPSGIYSFKITITSGTGLFSPLIVNSPTIAVSNPANP
jgi:hypothetical protein